MDAQTAHGPVSVVGISMLCVLGLLIGGLFAAGCLDEGGEDAARLRPTREQRIITNERLMVSSSGGFAQSEHFQMYGGLASTRSTTTQGESFEMLGLDLGLARQFLEENEVLKGNESAE